MAFKEGNWGYNATQLLLLIIKVLYQLECMKENYSLRDVLPYDPLQTLR